MRRKPATWILLIALSTASASISTSEQLSRNRAKCTDDSTGRVSEACALILLDRPESDYDDIEMDDFLEPVDFSLDDAVKEITEGSGYYLMKGMFTQKDVDLAKERVNNYDCHFLWLK